ncbi:putative zinc-binding protein [Ancylomarina sp. YFZ004]
MEDKKENCSCGAGNKIVMACSGAADVGLISDKVARMLHIGGERKMSCLSIIGAGIEKSIENFKTKNLLVIDGCPTSCGKRMMEQHEFTNYKHLVVTEQGLAKGQSPANDENIQKIYDKAKIIF